RGLGDRAVERGASELALQLQVLGRRLGFGERTDRVRCLLDALAAGGDNVLADRAGALGSDAAGLDHRLDVGAGEIGELLGDLLGTLRELLAALAGIGEDRLEGRERRDGVKAVEELVGHGLNPFLGRSENLPGGGAGFAAHGLGAARVGLLLGSSLALGAASGRGTLALRRLRTL